VPQGCIEGRFESNNNTINNSNNTRSNNNSSKEATKPKATAGNNLSREMTTQAT
jgi:hypothetical protein